MTKEIVDRTWRELHEAIKTNDWKMIDKKYKTYETAFELWIRQLERS